MANTEGATTYDRAAQREPAANAPADAAESSPLTEQAETTPQQGNVPTEASPLGRSLTEKEANTIVDAMLDNVEVVNVGDGLARFAVVTREDGGETEVSAFINGETNEHLILIVWNDKDGELIDHATILADAEGKANATRVLRYGTIDYIDQRGLDALAQAQTTAQSEASARSADSSTSEGSAPAQAATAETEKQEEAPNDEASPEEVFTAVDNEDVSGISPQMAHDAYYNSGAFTAEEADALIENGRTKAQTNLTKLQQSALKPKKNEGTMAFKRRKASHAAQLSHAEALVQFWRAVQDHHRQLGATAMMEAEQAKAQQAAEAQERAKAQAENGLPVAPSWASAEKQVGSADEFTAPNGLKVRGHYVLVEAGAAVPSHDATRGFVQSESFPTDEKGHTLNDRDYEHDADAQRVQREIARKYDSRAAQQAVVVSPEGYVLSGNGRTMSGDLAALENTDGAYNDYIRDYAAKWGFTPEQVSALEHPRIVFVADEPLPLTTETFAAFNAQDTKTQSRTEKTVKLGKSVSDEAFNKILRIATDGHASLAEFYGNARAAAVSFMFNLLIHLINIRYAKSSQRRLAAPLRAHLERHLSLPCGAFGRTESGAQHTGAGHPLAVCAHGERQRRPTAPRCRHRVYAL